MGSTAFPIARSMHVKLYEGYVKETKVLADGKFDQEEMPAYSELTRRLGFEYNGMVFYRRLKITKVIEIQEMESPAH
jgi:hypothetical protein